MNHIQRNTDRSGATVNTCHPERSLAKSEATRQTESKDPYDLHGGIGDPTNFHIAIRFFDDHDTEVLHESSREAATERSPRRKPWEDRRM